MKKLIQERKVVDDYDPDGIFMYAAVIDVDKMYAAKTQGAFVILNHKGEQMKLRSNKMVWKTKGAATLALNNHLMGHRCAPEPVLKILKMEKEKYLEMMKEKFPKTKDYRLWLEEKGVITIKQL